MTDLSEMQFEILPTVTAVEGVPFGIGLDISVDDKGFVPGSTDWSVQDAENPVRGGTAFGRDILQGPTWSWQLHVNEVDTESALAALGRFATAWRALHLRSTPGVLLAIRYRVGGRTRRVYGRPRRYEAPPDNLIMGGYIPVSVDFKAVDGFTYDDTDSSINLGLQQGSEGGFVFPITFPVTTLPVGLQQGQAVVDGDAATHPVVRFTGPVTNPELIHNDWSLTLDMDIPAGQYVEIDTRPWNLGVLQNGTASVAGALGKRQWLSDVKLEPGRHDLLFRGSSVSGGASCTVRWTSAWNSI